VHHHTIQINHQLDATISPVFYLTFIYGSTCFGHPHTHHQELNNYSRQPLVLPAEHGDSTAITMLRRYNQRLLLQLLSFWWWAWGRPKHVEP